MLEQESFEKLDVAIIVLWYGECLDFDGVIVHLDCLLLEERDVLLVSPLKEEVEQHQDAEG